MHTCEMNCRKMGCVVVLTLMMMEISVCTRGKGAHNDPPSRKGSNVENGEPVALFVSQGTNLLVALS